MAWNSSSGVDTLGCPPPRPSPPRRNPPRLPNLTPSVRRCRSVVRVLAAVRRDDFGVLGHDGASRGSCQTATRRSRILHSKVCQGVGTYFRRREAASHARWERVATIPTPTSGDFRITIVSGGVGASNTAVRRETRASLFLAFSARGERRGFLSAIGSTPPSSPWSSPVPRR